jgi:hypothetical protein
MKSPIERSPSELRKDPFVHRILRRAVERGQEEQARTGWMPEDASALVDATCRFVVEQTYDAALQHAFFALKAALPVGEPQRVLCEVTDTLRVSFCGGGQ